MDKDLRLLWWAFTRKQLARRLELLKKVPVHLLCTHPKHQVCDRCAARHLSERS